MKDKTEKRVEEIFKNPVQKKHIEVIRMQMVREGRSLYGAGKVFNPRDAVEIVRPLFEMADREMTVVLSMDTQGNPVAAEIVAVGGVDNCLVDVRNIFKHAILANASRLVLFHNHPAGELKPSEEDVLITNKVGTAGDYIGILLLDHIIIGEEGYYSFREHSGRGAFWSSLIDKKKRSDDPLWSGHY